MSSRADQKAQARAQRAAKQAAAEQAELRSRRLRQLGGLVLAVAAVVVVAIVISSSGGSGTSTPSEPIAKGAKPAQSAEIAAMLAGIPQHGQVLGKPSAPVTMTEFADLKCPVCRDFSAQALPTLVQRYVRTGKLRIVFEPQTFVGSPPGDSEHGARFALAAGAQGKFWTFTELWYANQQDESTGYATDGFIRQIASGVPGLDANRAFAARNSAAIGSTLKRASSAFVAAGFRGTPSFLLGRTGGTATPLNVTSFDPAQFTGPIDALLAG